MLCLSLAISWDRHSTKMCVTVIIFTPHEMQKITTTKVEILKSFKIFRVIEVDETKSLETCHYLPKSDEYCIVEGVIKNHRQTPTAVGMFDGIAGIRPRGSRIESEIASLFTLVLALPRSHHNEVCVCRPSRASFAGPNVTDNPAPARNIIIMKGETADTGHPGSVKPVSRHYSIIIYTARLLVHHVPSHCAAHPPTALTAPATFAVRPVNSSAESSTEASAYERPFIRRLRRLNPLVR
ncbi:hypothetical protein QTP88_003767 [Uroleucon formosanum]